LGASRETLEDSLGASRETLEDTADHETLQETILKMESSSESRDNSEEYLKMGFCQGSDVSKDNLQDYLKMGSTHGSQDTFEDYESMMSDIEETLSILSRNSRSTTPASEMFSSRTPTPSFGPEMFSSRTPTPSFGQFYSNSTSDLSGQLPRSVSDKHVIPVVNVFDDLKDYLSDSDMSLDYRISLQRRSHKKVRSLNKQAQLSSLLAGKKSRHVVQESSECLKPDKKDDKRHLGRNLGIISGAETDKRCERTLRTQALTIKQKHSASSDNFTDNRLETADKGSADERQSTEQHYRPRANSQDQSLMNDPRILNSLGASRDILLYLRQSKSPSREKSLEPQDSQGLRDRSRSFSDNSPAENPVQQDQYYPGHSGSLKRRKELRTASLNGLLQSPKEQIPSPQDRLQASYSPSTPNLVSFARSFQLSHQHPIISRIAVNKSVSDFNLSRGVGVRRETSVPPDLTRLQNSEGLLRSSVSESRLNALGGSPLHAPHTNCDKGSTQYLRKPEHESRLKFAHPESPNNSPRRNIAHQSSPVQSAPEQRSTRIRDLRNKFLGIETTSQASPHNNNNSCSNNFNHSSSTDNLTRSQRSQSLEPAELASQGWFGLNRGPRSSSVEPSGPRTLPRIDPASANSRPSLGCEEDGGLFHAVLARVDSNGSGDLSPADQDEDEEDDDEYDNEDAQTVIYKSPFSSPGLALSRSASLTLTPLPYSPMSTPLPPLNRGSTPLVPPPPSSPGGSPSPSPPPRPPPPTNYIPSFDQFASLPRNWKSHNKFLL